MLPSLIIFGIIAVVAIATAIAMLLTRNPVFAVIFLVLNFITVAVLYLILGAPFIAMAQVTVYAGAIMVLFLFVIMMLGTDRMTFIEPLKNQRWLVGVLAALFLVLIIVFLFSDLGGLAPMPAPEKDFGQPKDVGLLLTSQYVLPILVIGLILLAATIGVIMLTRRGERRTPPPVDTTGLEKEKEGI